MGVVNPPLLRGGLPALSAEQSEVLASWRQPLLVLGAPGVGKTTLLGQAAVMTIRSGGAQPVVLTSSRAAASRLRNAVTAELGEGSWRPTVTTVHGLARSLWQRFSGRAEVRLLSAPEQEFRVRELLAGADPDLWPGELRYAVQTRGFAAQVRAAIARARQLGLDPDDVIDFGGRAARPAWVALGRFFAEYLDVLDAEGVLDYAELVHRTRLLLDSPQVGAMLAAEVGAVLVDDYAELDASQLGLIASLSREAPLLAVADPDSVSAGFRGADPRAVREFAHLFGAVDRPAQVTTLTTTHRHGPGVVAALSRLRARIPRVAAGVPVTVAAADPPSEVLVLDCHDEAEQARAIADELRRARVLDGVAFSQMAVLVRSGRRQLAPLAQALIAEGIPVEVPGDEIPLAQAAAVRPLLLALSVALAGSAQPDEAVRLLTSPLGGFDAVGLRVLARQWRSAGHGDAAHLPLAAQISQALNDPRWAAVAVEGRAAGVSSDHGERLTAMATLLAAARRLLDGDSAVDRVLWQLWQGTDWPQRLAREATGDGPSAGRAEADLDALCALFDVAAETSGRGGAAGVRAFLSELAAQQIPADRQRESRPAGRGVDLLTAHRSRGREWQIVVVAGVQEGVWPAGRRMSVVLDASELDADGLLPAASPRELLASERRLFHLACSRARRRLVVTAVAGTEGESDAPSRFVAELGVRPRRPLKTELPFSLSGLVAELRRTATSATVAEPLRRAATAELARLADTTDPAGRPIVAAAQPRNWWGVRELSTAAVVGEQPIRLSPSQVSAALTCPRRYFLDRNSGSGEPSLAATLGSLIHRLIQLATQEGWGIAELRDELAAVWQRLPFEAAWFSASERVEVEQALARFVNWRAARDGELVAVEAGFRMELELDERAVELTGKIDWLERTSAGLRVADFKTSRTTPTKAQVAGMDQLGIYQLAIASGALAEIAGSGWDQPESASAVYLRQAGRPEDTPKEFWQPSILERPFLTEESSPYATWVHQRVAAAAHVVAVGEYPATPGPHCQGCAFASSCPADPRGRQVLR